MTAPEIHRRLSLAFTTKRHCARAPAPLAIKAALAASLLLAACASHAGAFETGVAEFHARRYAAAWGNFYMAANAGDADAARVALHMLKYGPLLYDGYWDASAEEVETWTASAARPRARPVPQYKPAPLRR